MKFFRWLLSLWRAQQRAHDLEILWPACKMEARGDLNLARTVFMRHAYMTPAWQALGGKEMYAIISNLT